ncbi:dihydropteroate synthase [Chitinophagaceae bacterium LB-8]|uniref:dihydropteroate synthase n=1 Tax=Paraflavisolibacter caeni TaxID=2982496 RepID=A0A9X2XXP8_9BACT|nr:dihydropteroate synthase [Paraflavisolibacter caeni]MCU7551479.1 dihydropteroate synthase [Paraflavisolibacter caeni]
MFTLNCKGKLTIIEQPLVMGILNVTPDSFFADSRMNGEDAVLYRAEQMLMDGATIIDIGGQSTRPGSLLIDEAEEEKRVIPAITALHKRFPEVLISVDTFYAKVAESAVDAGASIINDVSAGSIDEAMIETVAKLKVPYVLMHMTGNPQNMQVNPTYRNVVTEVFDFLNFRIQKLQELGISDIIVDPGFGFGKTIQHNFELLSGLEYFSQLGKPLLIGLSRKATIYKTLNINAEEALNGTTVLNTISLLKGAHILRVHDVKEAVQAVKLVSQINMV